MKKVQIFCFGLATGIFLAVAGWAIWLSQSSASNSAYGRLYISGVGLSVEQDARVLELVQSQHIDQAESLLLLDLEANVARLSNLTNVAKLNSSQWRELRDGIAYLKRHQKGRTNQWIIQ